MAGAVILAITYGIDVQSDDDEYVKLAESAIESLAVTGNAGSYVGAYLKISIIVLCVKPNTVDYLPICKCPFII